jgi:Domain of unknown function (DUF4375)
VWFENIVEPSQKSFFKEFLVMKTWHSHLQEILNTEGEDAAYTVLWNMLHARVYRDSMGTGFNSLTVHEKTIWVAGVFIGEVMNGGFYQFFDNSSEDYLPELPTVLERLGAKRMLELVRHAVLFFYPNGVQFVDHDRQNNTPDSIFANEEQRYESIDEIDSEFYNLAQSEYPGLLSYALENRNEFNFSEQEFLKAIEKEPYLLFPGDRLAYAKFDPEEELITLEIETGKHIIALDQLQNLSIVKVHKNINYSGLIYRLVSSIGTFDVPYFAKGEAHRNLIIWFFVDVMISHHLVGFKDALAEARSPSPMEPIVIWKNSSVAM